MVARHQRGVAIAIAEFLGDGTVPDALSRPRHFGGDRLTQQVVTPAQPFAVAGHQAGGAGLVEGWLISQKPCEHRAIRVAIGNGRRVQGRADLLCTAVETQRHRITDAFGYRQVIAAEQFPPLRSSVQPSEIAQRAGELFDEQWHTTGAAGQPGRKVGMRRTAQDVRGEVRHRSRRKRAQAQVAQTALLTQRRADGEQHMSGRQRLVAQGGDERERTMRLRCRECGQQFDGRRIGAVQVLQHQRGWGLVSQCGQCRTEHRPQFRRIAWRRGSQFRQHDGEAWPQVLDAFVHRRQHAQSLAQHLRQMPIRRAVTFGAAGEHPPLGRIDALRH